MTPSHSCDATNPETSTLHSLNAVTKHLLEQARPVQETKQCALQDALGCVLAKDLIAPVNVPPSDNSAVDGYALCAKALNDGKQQATPALEVSQRIPAGHAPHALSANTAARIFTGATVPAGADCVVMQEHCEVDATGRVTIQQALQEGQNIRRRGQDIQAGATVLHAGQYLAPHHIGLIASLGIAEVTVYRKLKVAYFSTGDELVEPGETLAEGQIFNSNRYMLNGLITMLGFEPIDLGVIPDTLEGSKTALQQACLGADAVVTSGGASVGEEDHIKHAIDALGTTQLWRVAIKPGKPFMYGEIQQTPILGLPGNPAAVLVTFSILARPFLLAMQNHHALPVASFPLPAAFDIKRSGVRQEYLRVKRNEAGQLVRHPNQSSGMLSSAAWADGFAVIPENSAVKIGDPVEFIPFSSLLYPTQ